MSFSSLNTNGGSNRQRLPENKVTYIKEKKWCKAYMEGIKETFRMKYYIDDTQDIVLMQESRHGKFVVAQFTSIYQLKDYLKTNYRLVK